MNLKDLNSTFQTIYQTDEYFIKELWFLFTVVNKGTIEV